MAVASLQEVGTPGESFSIKPIIKPQKILVKRELFRAPLLIKIFSHVNSIVGACVFTAACLLAIILPNLSLVPQVCCPFLILMSIRFYF
jgi:hypothetical protein